MPIANRVVPEIQTLASTTEARATSSIRPTIKMSTMRRNMVPKLVAMIGHASRHRFRTSCRVEIMSIKKSPEPKGSGLKEKPGNNLLSRLYPISSASTA